MHIRIKNGTSPFIDSNNFDLRNFLQEFFERKRFGTLKACSRSGNKKGLSQDLLALHTVSRAHSKNKSGSVQVLVSFTDGQK